MDQPILGEVSLVSFDFAPVRWARCEGQLLPIRQYEALFSLLGVTYGGDGRTTFALPDLRKHSPAPGLHFVIAIQGTYPHRP